MRPQMKGAERAISEGITSLLTVSDIGEANQGNTVPLKSELISPHKWHYPHRRHQPFWRQPAEFPLEISIHLGCSFHSLTQ